MLTTIDQAGRVVVPKPFRDQLGLSEGGAIDVRLEDGRIVIEPAPVAKRLVDGPHGVVLVPEATVPTLTAAEVRSILDAGRR